MPKTAQALLLAAVCGLAAGAARADVIYTFNTTSASATPGTTPAGGLALFATLDLTDAQVASGSFSLQGRGSGGTGYQSGLPLYSFTGDTSGFSRISIRSEQITPSYIYGSIIADFTFDPAGDVTSSDLRFGGVSEAAQVSGVGSSASGYVGSDNGTCSLGFEVAVPTTAPGQCSVSGFWSVSGDVPIGSTTSNVPEPASLAMLGAGLLGMVGWRRRS